MSKNNTLVNEGWELLTNMWVSRCIGEATKIGIFQKLKEGPKTAKQLAEECSFQVNSLNIVLRVLSAKNLLSELENEKYGLTELSKTFLESPFLSLLSNLIVDNDWKVCSKMGESLKTGKDYFHLTFGKECWEMIEETNAIESEFNRWMWSKSMQIIEQIPVEIFSSFKETCDIGGGMGPLTQHVLKNNPNIKKGIIVDRENTTKQASEFLKKRIDEDTFNRIKFHPGNFFTKGSIPKCNCYFIKSVIQDWNDKKSIEILKNVGESILDKEKGRVFIVEPVVPEHGNTKDGYKYKIFSLQFLLRTDGKQRTKKDFEYIIGEAGLKLEKIHKLPKEPLECILELKLK